jgi:dUTP pyrophosphatase
MQLNIKRVRDNNDLPLPAYQTVHAAGVDLRADIQENLTLQPGERTLIPTGIAIEVPVGYEAQIRPRSGLAIKKGISMVNTPGTIDADYRGEVGVIIINHGSEAVEIVRSDRIAQMVISPVVQPTIVEVQELSDTDRGAGGFGSTGK